VNFSLNGLDGKPWEFRKDRKGKLVLLHFWSSAGGLEQLAQLRDWQAKYETFGLQVVGISYETGPFAQQTQAVLSARGRYTLNYVTLLGGGGEGPCPVRTQFGADRLPELVLVGADGTIIARIQGPADADRLAEMRREIVRGLGINEP
jgi:hypothetical protein